MSLREDNSSQTNRGIDKQFANSRQDADNFSAQYGIIITVEALNASHVSKGHPKMTASTLIFLATAADDTLAFSNIGSAFTFILDSHADLNPEGSALMLAHNNTPATVKAVKASCRRVMDFTAAGADAASQVTKAQGMLDGALSACALVGVDPDNVATVGNLRAALGDAQALVDTDVEAVELRIEVLTLHKRGYKNS
jgi:hypothetical protein